MLNRRHAVFACGVLALLALLFAIEPLARRVQAFQVLSALSQKPRPGASAAAGVLLEREVRIPLGASSIRARIYQRAEGSRGRGLVLGHGVHYLGIDEPRLMRFARALAESGQVVLTPELSELTDYLITAQGVDVLSHSSLWLSEQRQWLTRPKVGLLGFSFAGGLALVAAERPALQGRLAFVSSVGGHHDLGRVLRFLVTDRIDTPRGTRATPAHEYGLVVLVRQHLDRFVDDADRAVLEDALRYWLREERAQAISCASRRTTESGERLFQLLEQRNLRQLRPDLERLLLERDAELRALSPSGRLRALNIPVYLLHGSLDSVIPPSETDWAAEELTGSAHRALISPLIEHVEVNRASGLGAELALLDFVAQLL